MIRKGSLVLRINRHGKRDDRQLPLTQLLLSAIESDLHRFARSAYLTVEDIQVMYPWIRVRFITYQTSRDLRPILERCLARDTIAWRLSTESREERAGWTEIEEEEWRERTAAGD